MKIAVFGCSWSQGVLEIDDNVCWPHVISSMHPNWEIDNFSLAGSSLSFQAFLLDDVLKNNTYDKVIFQFTSPNRITYFNDSLNYASYLKRDNNYRYLDRSGDIYRKFICITPGHMKLDKTDSFWNYPEKYQFAKLYYKYSSVQVKRTEYKALVNYVKNKTDFVYFHNEDVCNIGNIPVVMDIVGDKFVADSGDHFNQAGATWTAKWILDNI